MKKVILSATLILSSTLLVACSTSNESNSKNESSAETTTSYESMEVKEGPLTEIGQWKTLDGVGKMELLKINESPKTLVLTEGLEVTIESIKLFHVDNLEKSNPLLLTTDKTEGNVIQIITSAVNNTDTTYNGIFPDTLVLSDGTQIEHNRTFGTIIDLKPNAKADEMIFTYFIDEKIPSSMTLYYDSLYDENGIGIEDVSGNIEVSFE